MIYFLRAGAFFAAFFTAFLATFFTAFLATFFTAFLTTFFAAFFATFFTAFFFATGIGMCDENLVDKFRPHDLLKFFKERVNEKCLLISIIARKKRNHKFFYK